VVLLIAVGGQGRGKILQRFPEKDWDNCPFTQGIELVSHTALLNIVTRSVSGDLYSTAHCLQLWMQSLYSDICWLLLTED